VSEYGVGVNLTGNERQWLVSYEGAEVFRIKAYPNERVESAMKRVIRVLFEYSGVLRYDQGDVRIDKGKALALEDEIGDALAKVFWAVGVERVSEGSQSRRVSPEAVSM